MVNQLRLGDADIDFSANQITGVKGRSNVEPKVMDVLHVLTDRHGEVITRNEIIDLVWGTEHGGDENLSRAISLLRKALGEIRGKNQFIETVPKRGYRLIAPISNQDRTGEPNQTKAPNSGSNSVLAVLAFDNLSGDSDSDYLAEGISEEIMQTIAQGSNLTLIGRASSFQFRGKDKAARHISTQLGATHVLDGSVRISGNRMRVVAQLIECRSETSLWSDRFDRDLGDIFSLQDEIAAAIANALRVTFASNAPKGHVSAAAYDYYLRGRATLDRYFGSSNMRLALPLYETAVDEAPEFARAWAQLAMARGYVYRGFPNERPESVNRASVVEAAAAALRHDPNCGIAYLALNGLEAWGNYAERKAHLDTALSLAPNDPEVLMAAANLASRMGRLRDSVRYARTAWKLDPMLPVAGFYCVTMRDMDDHYRETVELSDQLLAQFPDVEYMWTSALVLASQSKDWPRLERMIEDLKRVGPYEAVKTAVFLAEGLRSRDPAFIDLLHNMARQSLDKHQRVDLRLLVSLHMLGACEETFALIDACDFPHIFDADAHPPAGWANESMLFSRTGNLEMMRDPRFITLCSKLGLCHYWFNSDVWPDCAEEGFLPYDFKACVEQVVAEG